MLTENFETHANRFLDTNLSPKDRLSLAQEIRESIEIVQTSEYGNFLQHFIKAFNTYLRGVSAEGSPYFVPNAERFQTEAPSYKTRSVLLEILNRVPTTEVLKPFAPDLLKLCMHLLENDDEDNAVIALRIILDLHKTYRGVRPAVGPLEQDVQPFLDFVRKAYENFDATLRSAFHLPGAAPKPAVRRSTESFKVVTECPLIVMFLFQLYDSYAPTNVQTLLPLMVKAINLRAPAEARSSPLFVDFIAAQVKTLSFLTYLLRGSADWVLPHKEIIPMSVVQLLVSCPHDSIAVRKELLVATRHILATDFRDGFFKHVDIFLDEKQLVGTSRGAGDSLRPLAYSLLAEVVHHVRLRLTMGQLSKAVHLFSRNVHDASLPLTVQTTSIRLLMNLVEGIYHKHNQDQDKVGAAQVINQQVGSAAAAAAEASVKGRKLLVRILDTFVRKFGTLKEYTKKLCEARKQEKYDDPSLLLEFMPFRSGSLSDIVIDITKEINDCKQLIKTLIVAVRTVVWSVSNVKGQSVVRGMQEHECLITAKLLKHGLKCFSIYSSDDAGGAKEEKEILDLFAGVFTVLDERTFKDVFTLNLGVLFQHLLQKESCIAIPQHFLSNQSVTRPFTDILLTFLVARIKDLSNSDKHEGQVVLNLFKIIFIGISTFPDNENVLRSHVRGIVIACLKHAMQEKRPTSYYLLLKTFFRSVANGKFELLQKEFIALLKNLLDSLCKLLAGAQEDDTKELLVELCLSVPARLNFLLPHIPLLMKPLVQALNGTPEMVHLGLKKLESWVESLQPAYLDPLLQSVKDDLMPALYKQLQSGNNNFAVAAIRILGKLGGRNRRLLRNQTVLEGKENGEDGLKVSVQLPKSAGVASVQLALDDAVKTSMTLLEKPAVDIYYKKQAIRLIKGTLGCLLPTLKISTPNEDTPMEATSLQDDLEAADKGMLTLNTEMASKKGLAKQAVCRKVVASVFLAANNPDLKEEVGDLVAALCRFFAVAVALAKPPGEGEPCAVYQEMVLLEVAVEALCQEQKPRVDKKETAAVQPLQLFLDFLAKLCTSQQAAQLPVYDSITRMLCHLCYQRPWWQKVAGCVGLQILVPRMPVACLLGMELGVGRALLTIWKDSAADEIAITAERSYATLAMVLHRCHAAEQSDCFAGPPAERDVDKEKAAFNDMVKFLSQELASPNSTVRSNVQKLLGELSQLTGKSVSELLEPEKKNIAASIFKRKLTQFPVAVQIGHLDALTYCLSLRPALLAAEQALLPLLRDALGVAEMEDNTVLRSHDGAAIAQLTTLRTYCVQLLRTAMASQEVNLAQNDSELRNQIILMFFKVITKGFPDAVIAAREGLAEVLQSQKGKAPFKDLLQSSLRPVLVNLADYRKLNVPLLEGLSRLLELLSSWFNVTLGEKLLDYLQKWAEPENKAPPPGTPKQQGKTGEEPRIPAAIIELFHLLPPAPDRFMEKLANLTIELELKLPSAGDYSQVRSPYRAPFTKFLNRFPSEALDFFYERLREPRFCKLFHHILRSETASPLRDEVKRCEDKLLTSTFQVPDTVANYQELRFQGICIVRTMCNFFPDWLRECPRILEQLITVWKSPERLVRMQGEEGLELEHLLESKKLVKCLLSYARCKPDDHEVLFNMLTIFTTRSVVDYSFLKQFYAHEVANGYTLSQRKAMIVHMIDKCKDPKIPQELKVQALQLVVIPTLTSTFSKPQQPDKPLLDEGTITTIVKDLLDPGEEILREYDEAYHIELLQLATLLIRHLKKDLVTHRKELIKFAWDRLKRDETSSKQWAYVNVCRFIEAYEAPPKIILQVYVALLRAFQPEQRPLLKQALDILTPALPKRLPPQEHKYPIWIRYTKKIIVEEGHSLPHLIHIWHFLVRHADLFYSSRAQFVPQMVNSLNRIGMANSCPVENRKLAIDLAELVMTWDSRRLEAAKKEDKMQVDVKQEPAAENKREEPDAGKEEGAATKKIKTEAGAAVTATAAAPAPAANPAQPAAAAGAAAAAAAAAAGGDDDYQPNSTMIEMVVNFLMRVALIAAEPKETAHLSERCVKLLDKALAIWPTAVLKFQYFEKVIEKSDNHAANLYTGLEIINTLLDRNMLKSLAPNHSAVNQLLNTCLPCDNAKVIDALCRMVTKYMEVPSPEENKESIAQFMGWLKALIAKGLKNVGEPQTGRVERASIHNAERVLQALAAKKPDTVDEYANQLVKVVQKFSREHCQQTQSRGRQQESTQDAEAQECTTRILVMGMQLLSTRLNVLGEHRKTFLLSISILVDRSVQIERTSDSQVLSEVATIVGQWITDPNSGLKIQEKTNFVHKMMTFEHGRNSGPYTIFLQMVYDLISNPNPPEPELVVKVQRACMIGLRCRDPEMRKNFFRYFEGQVHRSLFQRLTHIIQKQEWDAIGDSYWLKHAVELLLCIANNTVQLGEGIKSDNSTQMAEAGGDDKTSVVEVLAENDAFLNGAFQTTTASLLEPLCELLHHSNALAHSMWVETFPYTWGSLTVDEQLALTKPLGMLIARDCNKFQDLRRPNVVQGLLEAVHRCRPPPAISPPILRFAGRTFNAWHSALSILEDQITTLQYASDGRKDDPEEVVDALSDLYRRLGEHDVMCGLWCRQSAMPDTKVSLSYLQFGYWSRAQDALFAAMSKSQTSGSATKTEKTVWEEQWVQCAKHLNQWDSLTAYAREVNQFDLQLECHWKNSDWSNLRDLLQDPMPSDPSQTKIFDIYNALQEGRLQDAEKHCQEAFQYALKSWCLLPEVTVQAYVPLMQTFHQLVELHESALLLDEVQKSMRHNSVPELKNTISAWRERLPNKWDEITVWFELLTWRNHVFKMLTECSQISQEIKNALQVLGSHEEAWTLVKFAECARKQGLPSVSLSNIAKIPDVQHVDAGAKKREEVLARLELGTAADLSMALNLINKTNIEYFAPTQKAEMLRLKGELLSRIPDGRSPGQTKVDDAHQALSTALGTCDSHGKGWLSWGNLWDHLLTTKKEKTGPHPSASDVQQRNQYVEYVINCYLQGVKHGCDRARFKLAKVLWLVEQYEDQPSLGAEFDKNVDSVPSWNWISWIPTLLGALSRPTQAQRARKLLSKLAAEYPQALYCPLRRFLIEKQGQSRASEDAAPKPAPPAAAAAAAATPTAAAAAATPTAGGGVPAPPPADAPPAAPPPPDTPTAPAAPPAPTPAAPAAAAPAAAAEKKEDAKPAPMTAEARAAMVVRQHAQEIMKHLRDTHLPFFLETERFVVEITRSFKPWSEQQLQHLFAHQMDALSSCNLHDPPSKETCDKLEQALNDLFTGLEQQLEQEKAKGQTSKESPHQATFLSTYKPLVTADFMKQNGVYPYTTNRELYMKLRKWQVAVRRQLSRLAAPRQLESLSRALSESKGSQMEIPGQYLDMKEPMPDQHVKVERVLPDIEVVDRNLACHRRITIRGNDGKFYHFVVEATGTAISSSDERTLQLCQLINRCMEKEKQTRRRHMSLHIRPIVGLAPRCRLIQDDPKLISLMEVLEDFLSQRGQTPDGVALKFAEKAQMLSRTEKDPLMAAMNEVADILPDTVLLDFVRAQIPTNAHLWSFRKHMAVQYACHVLVSRALFVAPATPSRLVMSQTQGDVVLAGAMPGLSKDMLKMEDEESMVVPFRMTRMMTTLLSPIGLEGGFSAALGAAAMALSHPHRQLHFHLCSLLREELLAAHAAAKPPGTVQAAAEHSRAMLGKAEECAAQVVSRVVELSPATAVEKEKELKEGELPPPLNNKVIQLIMAAADPVKQIEMPCLWHPWA